MTDDVVPFPQRRGVPCDVELLASADIETVNRIIDALQSYPAPPPFLSPTQWCRALELIAQRYREAAEQFLAFAEDTTVKAAEWRDYLGVDE